MRRRLTLTLTLLTCLLALAPAASASWLYATQTQTGAHTASRYTSGGCSLRTVDSALRFACTGTGVARARYKFQLPSNLAGTPAASLVPTLGPYHATVSVVGSTATVTVKVVRGTYTLKWVNLVYYVRS